jgi:PPP family 3-phenylpropionic acid transporter
MQKGRSKTFHIEAIFAGMHSSYWLAMCVYSGFMAVDLSYYGFSDALIGLTASIVSLISIIFQLGISSFSDANDRIPLKKIITVIYLAILGLVSLLALVPMPLIMMLLTYALAGGMMSGMPGLYNAQIIQFVNEGLPVNLGWPRGVSALMYAIFAYFLGLLLDRFSPGILMPICLICIAISILMVLVMPRPGRRPPDESAIPDLAQPVPHTSLRQMLRSNLVMQVFLLSSIFMSAGQSNMMLFLPRVIESKGGNEAALGVAMFLQAGVEMPAMFLSPFLLRRFRPRAILSVSAFAYFIKSLIIYLSRSIGGIYAAMAFSVFCYGLYGISSVYFVNNIVRPNERVRGQSLVTASGALSAIISNSTAGWLVETRGISTLNLVCVILQSIAAGLMIYCAWLHIKKEKLQHAASSLSLRSLL